uniref:Integrase catalytic domain-containing protein n=1 Tax=Gouania willdenowi TaxID=441366 RepID=A0A8C5HEM7_GOUWI
MSSDVKKYVVSCVICQTTKPSQRKTAGFMVPIQPQRPWEYTSVDYVGPLPRSSSGNAYILVFVDYFSKWIEVSAVREATVQVAAKKFISDIFDRHGSPSYLISDRGTPFVKRVNRTLKTAIRAYVEDKHTSWDKFLPQICFALRTAPHESTGFSPSMMLYGRELETPLDLVTQPSWDGVDDHIRRKRYYDLRRRDTSYEIGDLVRVKSHPRSDAQASFTAKLAPLYTGPYRISRRMSNVNYVLTRVDSGEEVGVFHVANLLPFYTWDTASTTKQLNPNLDVMRYDTVKLNSTTLSNLMVNMSISLIF